MSSRNGSRVVVNGFVNGAAKRRSQGPRTRSSIRKTDEESIRERLGNVPNLKEFMHKQTVIKQYRTFFRVVKLIPDEEWRVHCHNEIRTSFELNKNESSRLSRMAAVKEGEKKLDQLKSMVGYRDPKDTTSDEDSWLNIKDDEDPRGRVGIDWPWDKKE